MRGLKYRQPALIAIACTSHPTRMRGLKLVEAGFMTNKTEVASYADAWIEITADALVVRSIGGRILRGCVD